MLVHPVHAGKAVYDRLHHPDAPASAWGRRGLMVEVELGRRRRLQLARTLCPCPSSALSAAWRREKMRLAADERRGGQ
jgi:hypothetical protein